MDENKEKLTFVGDQVKCPECGSLDTCPEMGGGVTDLDPTYWISCKKCKHAWNQHQ